MRSGERVPGGWISAEGVRGPGRAQRLTRLRLIHAAAEVACETGLGELSRGRVARAACVSLEDFDAVFADVAACVRAGREEALRRAAAAARIAASGDPENHPQAALDGLLEFAEQQQELAGLCVEMALASGGGNGREREVHAALAPALALVARALDLLAEEPALGARLAARAKLASVAQAARLTVRLCELRLCEDAPAGLGLTARGRAFADLIAA